MYTAVVFMVFGLTRQCFFLLMSVNYTVLQVSPVGLLFWIKFIGFSSLSFIEDHLLCNAGYFLLLIVVVWCFHNAFLLKTNMFDISSG